MQGPVTFIRQMFGGVTDCSPCRAGWGRGMSGDQNGMPMINRNILPQRRPCQTFDVWHGGQHFHVSVGRFHDGTLAEIFINGGKPGSDLEAVARDAAVTLSIALQYGVPLDPVRHAVTRNADGSPSSIVGAVLERLALLSTS